MSLAWRLSTSAARCIRCFTRVFRSRSQRDIKSASEHNLTSPLLSLPGEIRNLVYEYALGNQAPIILISIRCRLPEAWSLVQDAKDAWKTRPYQPPITCVCKQLRVETLPQFYERTLVIVDDVNVRTRRRKTVKIRSWDLRSLAPYLYLIQDLIVAVSDPRYHPHCFRLNVRGGMRKTRFEARSKLIGPGLRETGAYEKERFQNAKAMIMPYPSDSDAEGRLGVDEFVSLLEIMRRF